MGEQVFSRVVPLAEFFLVDEVVDPVVAGPAEVKPTRLHLGFRIPAAEPPLAVVLARDQVVKVSG